MPSRGPAAPVDSGPFARPHGCGPLDGGRHQLLAVGQVEVDPGRSGSRPPRTGSLSVPWLGRASGPAAGQVDEAAEDGPAVGAQAVMLELVGDPRPQAADRGGRL